MTRASNAFAIIAVSVIAATPVLAGPPLPVAGGETSPRDVDRATHPIEAIVLHDGPLDMVAYYVPTEGAALEVTATFAPAAPSGPAAPMRIVMAMDDGDDVAFAMPGYPEQLFRFSRDGAAVNASVREVIEALGQVASAR